MTQESSSILPFLAFLNRESETGLRDFSFLRETPVANWPQLLETAATAPSYGILRSMLTHAREQFDRDPQLAVAITNYVTDHVEKLVPVAESVILTPFIRGLAWKEHANALYMIGQFDDAAVAAEKAISIFSSTPALASDLAAATLVRAMSLHALGRTDDALQLAITSVHLAATYDDPARYLVSVQVCGGILFDLGNYSSALDAYSVALSVVEKQGNQREYARMLNNRGMCNLLLDNMETAEQELQQAFRLFQQQRMESEIIRTVAVLGRITYRQGTLEQAVAVCHTIYADLLYQGLTLAAAQVLVELTDVMTEITGNSDYARDKAARLAAAFGEEDVPANLRDAMAFLEQQTIRTQSVSELRAATAHVRRFLWDVVYTPSKAFASPSPAAKLSEHERYPAL